MPEPSRSDHEIPDSEGMSVEIDVALRCAGLAKREGKPWGRPGSLQYLLDSHRFPRIAMESDSAVRIMERCKERKSFEMITMIVGQEDLET
jgi:hypothetical protein